MIKVSCTVVSRKKKIKLEKKHGEIYSQALLCRSEKENVAMPHQTTSSAILSQPKTILWRQSISTHQQMWRLAYKTMWSPAISASLPIGNTASSSIKDWILEDKIPLKLDVCKKLHWTSSIVINGHVHWTSYINELFPIILIQPFFTVYHAA